VKETYKWFVNEEEIRTWELLDIVLGVGGGEWISRYEA